MSDCPNDAHLCFDAGYCERNGCQRSGATFVPAWNGNQRSEAAWVAARLHEMELDLGRFIAKLESLDLSSDVLDLTVTRSTVSRVRGRVCDALAAVEDAIRR